MLAATLLMLLAFSGLVGEARPMFVLMAFACFFGLTVVLTQG